VEVASSKVGSVIFSITTLGDLYALCSIFANAFARESPSEMRKIAATSATLSYPWLLQCHWRVHPPGPAVDPNDIHDEPRIVMVVLMVGTVAGAYGADEPHFGSQVGPVNDVSLAISSNIASVTMTYIFATSFQFSVRV
jgi:hypothetical protein